MSTDIKQVLERATPRPWEAGLERFGEPNKRKLWHISLQVASTTSIWTSVEEQEANAELTALAVNSFESNRELIAKLVEALGEIECASCNHALRKHLDEYGCEYEYSDHPCQCKGEFPEDLKAIAALAKVKEAGL